MSNKRVACYARVSTADQSTGLESQVRVLKQYCESNSIQSVEFFTDEGISGTKANRPALDRDSDLIRKLLKAGMSYRNISVVARCSHGSVSAERTAMKREEAELKKKLEEQAEAEKQLHEASVYFPEIAKNGTV